MANPEQLRILRLGHDAWRGFREGSAEVPDLRHADFAGARLEGMDLGSADLTGAVLDGADLSGSNLDRAILSGASLRNASLRAASFRGADLTDARLDFSRLTGADFSEARMPRVGVTHVDGEGSLFARASMQEARFTASSLEGADFREAQAAGACFREADLTDTRFDGTTLAKARFQAAILQRTLFRRPALAGAEFQASFMIGAIFAATDLREALGLQEVFHGGPSTVGLDTLAASDCRIPEQFLRGAGVAASILHPMLGLMRTAASSGHPGACILIGGEDRAPDSAAAIACKLHDALTRNGIQTWFNPGGLVASTVLHDDLARRDTGAAMRLVLMPFSPFQPHVAEQLRDYCLTLQDRDPRGRAPWACLAFEEEGWQLAGEWLSRGGGITGSVDFQGWRDPEGFRVAVEALRGFLQTSAGLG